MSAAHAHAYTVAIVGAGKMGETLASGLLQSGWPAERILATTRREQRSRHLVDRYGIRVVDNGDAVAEADVVVIAVKPQDATTLLDELGPAISPRTLVVSICAGLPTVFFENRLQEKTPVIRVMSNTPARVDEAMSAISAGEYAGDRHLDIAEVILGSVGKTIRLPEYQQDAVTALSGSGPAYFYYVAESMVDAGILLGLPRSVAHELVVQAAVGAAAMLRESGEPPVLLREAVTSPAGTTINAIRELENHKVRAAVIDAVEAARNRGQEIARSVD